MRASCSFDETTGEWRIHIAETFDVEEAKACLQRFRMVRGRRLSRLVLDLSATEHLQTAGLGTMLYIHSCCQVSSGNAHIVYQNPQVGMILRLANMDRWFTLVPQGAALREEAMPGRFEAEPRGCAS